MKEVQSFLEYLKFERNYSENTLLGYENELRKYYQYLEEKKIHPFKITKQEIWDYLKYLDQLKYTNTSVARHITALRSYYSYLKEQGYIVTNIFKTVHNPKTKRKLPDTLNYEEITTLLDFQNETTPRDLLCRCMFELLYATGMRVSELVNVQLKDIDLKERTIRTLGKGSKERIVLFGDYAKEALEDYLAVRNGFLKGKRCDYLFLNTLGNQMSRSSAEQMVSARVKKVAMQHHVSPHTLRHTFATHLILNGADIRTVQELLGHEKLNTTQIYTHLSNEYLRQEYFHKMKRK